jgi:hypothetical protein
MVDRKLLEQLQKVDTEKALLLPTNKFAKYLIEDMHLFGNERDFKLFVLEYLQKAYMEDNADWPIRYYEDDTPFAEDEKHVDADIDALTDETVEQMKLNNLPPAENIHREKED